MNRWAKILLVSVLLAILLTAAFRFLHHTDREYSQWIRIYGESATRLEARCAELKTPRACAAARDRRSLVTEFESYHGKVMAWWWPTLVAMSLTWIAAIVSLFPIARRFFFRRRAEGDVATRGKPKD